MHPVLTAFAEDAVAAHLSATDSVWELSWILQEVQAHTTDHDLCLSCIYSQPFLLYYFFPGSDTVLIGKKLHILSSKNWHLLGKQKTVKIAEALSTVNSE